MAIYHLRGQVIGRKNGRSSVAAAAYRSGSRLVDRRTGLVHDYTRRRAQIESWIEAPDDAPGWVRDRQELWNGVEQKERRKDAQLCREFDIALPVELDEGQQRDLIQGYVREQFVAEGMVADVAIHRDKRENPHAHIMLSMREVGPEGFERKNRSWNDRDLASWWRAAWARDTNRELERAGSDERVDHRSNKARGIDREPTIHEGPDVREMEAREIRTDRGEQNRAVQERNHRRERLHREADRRGVSPEELEKLLAKRSQEPEREKDPVQMRRAERLRQEREDRDRNDDRDI